MSRAPADALVVQEDRLEADLVALRRAALEAIAHNAVRLNGRWGLSAGGNQFRTLWTRDFCYAARGLLRAGRADVVRDHLELVFAHRRGDGLLARGLDSIDPKLRVVWASVATALPFLSPRCALTAELKPEFLDQHGSEAIDGNALAVWIAGEVRDATGDDAWWDALRPTLEHALGYYRFRWLRRGLIRQPAFSDWQDSVRREGVAFLTNLLHWAAQRTLDPDAAAATQATIEAAFRPTGRGLYPSLLGRRFQSIDGNLLALDIGFVTGDAARALYDELRACPLWTRHEVPGFPTAPDYPVAWRNPGVIAVGLGHYHDRISWPWLSALAAKVAAQQGDLAEARRILKVLAARAGRDGTLVEIYDPRPPHLPWRSWLYRSERPFSWAAGMTLDALATYEALS